MSSIPKRVGKYSVVRRLGRGGTAEIYLAELQGTAGFSKQVVLKVLYPDLAADEGFVKMLVDEARITARLIHTNICQVLDLGLESGACFLTMEYVPGVDVHTMLEACEARQVAVPLEAAAYIIAEVLAGLDCAHTATDGAGVPLGIIHRDVSPQNVLISHHGEVKLTDFGVAKAAQRQTRTQSGQIKGKMIYMSPEHASGRPMDARADVFSAGIMLHELLRGQAFAAADSNVVLQMRKAGMAVESIQKHRPEVPPELEFALRRALQPDPDERYSTAEEFRAALSDFLFGRPLPFGRRELAGFLQEVLSGPARRLAEEAFFPRSRVGEPTVRAPIPREPGGLDAVATCPDDMGAILAAAGEGGLPTDAPEETTMNEEAPPELQNARTEVLRD